MSTAMYHFEQPVDLTNTSPLGDGNSNVTFALVMPTLPI